MQESIVFYCVYNVVVYIRRKFTFAISSPDEFLVFLANVNMSSRSLYVIARLSSVTLVHPTQAIEIFDNVSTPFGTLAIY